MDESALRAPASLLPLTLDRACFEAGGRRIVDAVSLVIEAGSRTVILGPNGAGKSVLLRLCHGLLAPTAGRIQWNARERTSGARQQAMVFQGVLLAILIPWVILQIVGNILSSLNERMGSVLLNLNGFMVSVLLAVYVAYCLWGALMTYVGRPFYYAVLGRRVFEGALRKTSVEE